MKTLWNHLTQWLEGYLWPIIALAAVPAYAYAVRLISGRPPAANLDWMVDGLSGVRNCIFVILFVSVTREANGHWLTAEQAMENPWLAFVQAFKACVFAIIFAFLLSH